MEKKRAVVSVFLIRLQSGPSSVSAGRVSMGLSPDPHRTSKEKRRKGVIVYRDYSWVVLRLNVLGTRFIVE